MLHDGTLHIKGPDPVCGRGDDVVIAAGEVEEALFVALSNITSDVVPAPVGAVNKALRSLFYVVEITPEPEKWRCGIVHIDGQRTRRANREWLHLLLAGTRELFVQLGNDRGRKAHHRGAKGTREQLRRGMVGMPMVDGDHAPLRLAIVVPDGHGV